MKGWGFVQHRFLVRCGAWWRLLHPEDDDDEEEEDDGGDAPMRRAVPCRTELIGCFLAPSPKNRARDIGRRVDAETPAAAAAVGM